MVLMAVSIKWVISGQVLGLKFLLLVANLGSKVYKWIRFLLKKMVMGERLDFGKITEMDIFCPLDSLDYLSSILIKIVMWLIDMNGEWIWK